MKFLNLIREISFLELLDKIPKSHSEILFLELLDKIP